MVSFLFSINYESLDFFLELSGLRQCQISSIFYEYNMEYKPDIISLLKTRVNGSKADKIIAKLGFQFSHRVKAIGYVGGI